MDGRSPLRHSLGSLVVGSRQPLRRSPVVGSSRSRRSLVVGSSPVRRSLVVGSSQSAAQPGGWQPGAAQPGGWQQPGPAQPGGWQQPGPGGPGFGAPGQPQYGQPGWGTGPAPASSGSNGCWKWGAIALVAFMVLGVVGCGVAIWGASNAIEDVAEEVIEQTEVLPTDKYELKLDCRDVGGSAVASGTFKNKTGTAQGFQVDIDFETNGVRFDQQTQFLTTVRNGATTAIEAESSVLIPEGELRCSGTVRRSLFDNLDGTFPPITAVG